MSVSWLLFFPPQIFPSIHLSFKLDIFKCVSPTVEVIQRWCWISLPSNIQVSVPVFPNQRQWCNKPPRHQRTACSGAGKKPNLYLLPLYLESNEDVFQTASPPLTTLFPAIPKTDICLDLYNVIYHNVKPINNTTLHHIGREKLIETLRLRHNSLHRQPGIFQLSVVPEALPTFMEAVLIISSLKYHDI